MSSRVGKLVLRVGSLCAAAGVGVATYTLLNLSSQLRGEPYYVGSLSKLYGYQEGMQILGEPVKDKVPEFVSSTEAYDPKTHRNWTDGHVATLTIDLEGKKKIGTLYSWCHKIGEEWTVDKCDMEVDNRRWTFYIDPSSKGFEPSTDDPSSRTFPSAWYGVTRTMQISKTPPPDT